MARDQRSRKVLPPIDIEIDTDGSATIDVGDGCGSGCTDLTAGLEAALGGVEGDRELKPSYHKKPVQREGSRQKGRERQ